MQKPEFNTFTIPKRKGGYRTIFEQTNRSCTLDDEIKIRNKATEIIDKYNVKNTPLAYCEGVSIEHHIKQHLGNNKFVAIDIKSFFDECTFGTIDNKDLSELESLIHPNYYVIPSRRVGFKQGSAISGDVTNAILAVYLDGNISNNVCYSRYADDILLSSDSFDKIQDEIDTIKLSLRRLGLRINDGKTKYVNLSDRRKTLSFLGYNIKKSKVEGQNLVVTITRKNRNYKWAKNKKKHLQKVINDTDKK